MKRLIVSNMKLLYWIADIACILLSYFVFALVLTDSPYFGNFAYSIVISIICFTLCFNIFKIYRYLWTRASSKEYFRLVIVSIVSATLSCLLCYFYDYMFETQLVLPVRRLPVACLFQVFLIVGYRVTLRLMLLYARYYTQKSPNLAKKRILIIGAGESTKMLLNDIRQSATIDMYKVVGLIDDDPLKYKTILAGAEVLGNRFAIESICQKKNVDEIIISIPSADDEELQNIITICNKTGRKVKIIPGLSQILKDQSVITQIRDVSVDDLLARKPIVLDNDKISSDIKDKVVLVTGVGSIGSELCRQIANFSPAKLVMLDIYENNAYDIQNELLRSHPELKTRVLVASIRDRERLEQIFDVNRPNIVFHAAAHKHVPLMEESPGEAIKNNIFGTYNMAKCADKFGVSKFVMISTDKAVNPTNIMGATKRFCEMIVQSMQTISKTEFVAVRFGNVLGSNGSVIPLFKQQIKEGGPVTVTHKNITRFFMTIPEAAQLVLQASAYASGGEIFVLDMGKPVRIYDLALNLIRLSGFTPDVDIKIEITGLRKGEKLYEELLMDEENLSQTEHSKIFVGRPTFSDIQTIETDLIELKNAVESNDPDVIREVMSKVVPTYAIDPEEYNSQREKIVQGSERYRTQNI